MDTIRENDIVALLIDQPEADLHRSGHRSKDVMREKTKPTELDDEIRPEYDFSKMRIVGCGIFRERFRVGTYLALLDRDVREAFPDDESVNQALRVIAKAAREQASKVRKPPVRSGSQTSRARRAG